MATFNELEMISTTVVNAFANCLSQLDSLIQKGLSGFLYCKSFCQSLGLEWNEF